MIPSGIRFGVLLAGVAALPCLVTAQAAAGETVLRASRPATAESAVGIYHMPRGDHAASRGYERVEEPRRSPTPDAELKAIKGGSRSEATPDEANEADTAAADTGAAEAAPRAVLANCTTNIPTGSAPPDIHGAASPSNLVVVTNRDIGIYSRATCGIVSRVSLASFFGSFSIPTSESLFDPRVLYDRPAGRCIVLVESRNSGNTDQFLYVAASTNSSCTSWRRIRFVLSRVSPAALFCKAAASDFYDYPNVGYNSRRIVVTANNFPTAGSTYGSVISIDKTALYGTATVTAACFRSGLGTNLAPSIVGDASTSLFILSPGSGSGSTITRRRLDTTTNTLVSTASISIPAWTAPPDAVQPNGQKVDTLDGRFQSATKQIGSNLWQIHTVSVGGFARMRWYKLSTTGTSPLFTRTPSTSTCSGAEHLFNPSIDTNSTFSGSPAFVSYSRTCPGNATVGRAAFLISRGANDSNAGWVFNTIATSTTNFATDGFGTACSSTSRGSCRWGDYSSVQIDPLNVTRAWGFNQLVNGTTQFDWATRGALVGP